MVNVKFGLVLALVLAGCGNGNEGDVKSIDAPAIDAAPDAFECPSPLTLCDESCVSFESPQHCGGCNMACAAGQSCVSGQCDCPMFDPSTSATGAVHQEQQGFYVAAAPYQVGARTDGYGIVYKPDNQDTPLNTPIALNGNFFADVVLGFAYNGSFISFNAEALYVATAGEITFTEACRGRTSATISNVTFSPVDLQTGQVQSGGCDFSVPDATINVVSSATCQ